MDWHPVFGASGDVVASRKLSNTTTSGGSVSLRRSKLRPGLEPTVDGPGRYLSSALQNQLRRGVGTGPARASDLIVQRPWVEHRCAEAGRALRAGLLPGGGPVVDEPSLAGSVHR